MDRLLFFFFLKIELILGRHRCFFKKHIDYRPIRDQATWRSDLLSSRSKILYLFLELKNS
ncbi:hypothetical protein YC2023_060325 [Brassica napus]